MRPLFLIPLATTLALAAPVQAASPIADVICEPGATVLDPMSDQKR
jgi:hypothetical protein